MAAVAAGLHRPIRSDLSLTNATVWPPNAGTASIQRAFAWGMAVIAQCPLADRQCPRLGRSLLASQGDAIGVRHILYQGGALLIAP